jgi:hypothetical protein
MEAVTPESLEPLNAVAADEGEPVDAPPIAASERSADNLPRN